MQTNSRRTLLRHKLREEKVKIERDKEQTGIRLYY